ncbi:GNAT family N-acetyltransferase [Streptomyces sp. SID8354]|nr:GNAT family N-acetyltransferase [Streptomyces sp. SID8354]
MAGAAVGRARQTDHTHPSDERTARAELVGCSTVRPPEDEARTATVIARVLAAHRGRGFGSELYARGLDRARELGAQVVETVVLSSNPDGLRSAERHGFVELERYVLPGETVPWIDLRLR